VDLDGTLLGPDNRVAAADAAALGRAAAAGVMVVPCTGRAWHESRGALGQVAVFGGGDGAVATGGDGSPRPGIFATGAAVNDVVSGRMLSAEAMPPAVVRATLEHLSDQPDAVLLYRDAGRVDHEYLITGGPLTVNTRWWFEHTRTRFVERPEPSEADLTHVLRMAMVTGSGRLGEVEQRLREALPGRLEVHHFAGLKSRDSEPVMILEVFGAGVNKWTGLQRVAAEAGIDKAQVAFIGDEINDIAALRHAGCGIAMANAADSAKAVADRHTRSNGEGGVAHAVGRLLGGQW
jgi:Cof subfamily protein (haloacid dehalogenase superfamily)